MEENPLPSEQDYPPGVDIIKDIYFGLLFIFPFGFVMGVVFSDISIMFSNAIIFFVYLAAYYGLSRKKAWAVPFVLIISTWGLLNSLLKLLTPSSGLMDLSIKLIFDSLFFIFSFYSVFIFSKSETRHFFKAKGKILV
jgi:hypothetical protein